MNLLDRYIARQYLINIIILLVILSCFVITVDFSLNLGRYWNARFFRENPDVGSGVRRVLVTALLVIDLWWPRLLHLFNFLLGLILVGAMGFTLSQLVRHRELVAVLTSGQSLFRVARPFLVVAVGMTLLSALNQQFITPRIADRLTRESRDIGRKEIGESRLRPTVDAAGRVFYANAFDADEGVLTGLYVWEKHPETRLPTRCLIADRAVWRNGAWNLQGAAWHSRVVGSLGKTEPASRLDTDLDPTMLKMKRYAIYGQNVSFTQAAAMLRRLDSFGSDKDVAQRNRDQLVRAGLGRISSMMSGLLTLLITMSFFLQREPRSMPVQALKCAPIGIGAIIAGVVGASAAVPGVPTAVSVFIPVMALTPIAIAMLSRVRT
jgi:lipopolysaccharide export LptBFGC system permease protein LptF